MPFFGVGATVPLCSRRPHRTFVPLSPSYKVIVQVETRSLCADGSRWSMPFFGVGPPPSLCSGALAVPIGRLYRSRHRAGRSFKSRRDRCALVVLDALFGVGPPPPLCSRRPHRTFIPLSLSCRAINQVETRCLLSRCSMPFFRHWPPPPLLCSRRPHRTFLPLSPLCKAIVQVETLSMRSWFSMPFFGASDPGVAELSPST